MAPSLDDDLSIARDERHRCGERVCPGEVRKGRPEFSTCRADTIAKVGVGELNPQVVVPTFEAVEAKEGAVVCYDACLAAGAQVGLPDPVDEGLS
jgi:hypothetical protein